MESNGRAVAAMGLRIWVRRFFGASLHPLHGSGEVAPAQVMVARDADELTHAPVCTAMHTLMQVLSPDAHEAIGQVIAFKKEPEQAALVARAGWERAGKRVSAQA